MVGSQVEKLVNVFSSTWVNYSVEQFMVFNTINFVVCAALTDQNPILNVKSKDRILKQYFLNRRGSILLKRTFLAEIIILFHTQFANETKVKQEI